MEQPNILQIIHDHICGRNDFFSDMRRIPYLSRPSILARYMQNEAMILEFMNRAYTLETQARLTATSLLTLVANANPAFQDPVVVVPTQAQIHASLEPHPSTTANCAICQEQIETGACRIRQCGHVYHRSCIVNWFSMSVRCPVCRYDIREGDRVTQTSPAEDETSSQ